MTQNEERRPRSANRAATPTLNAGSVQHIVSRPTDVRRQPRVRGMFVVDLTDLEPWAHVHDELRQARSRMWDISSLPAGADVIIRPGRFRPGGGIFDGGGFDRLASVTVESNDADQIVRWMAAIREMTG